ncbi:MAG: class III signal peptide-containing protein [Candidatus Micrarchaeota archaeon]
MRKGQGAFEYILLLGGILAIATVAFFILRSSATSSTTTITFAHCKTFLVNVNACYFANQTWKPDTTTKLNAIQYGMDPKCTVDGTGGLFGTQWDVAGSNDEFYCGSDSPF